MIPKARGDDYWGRFREIVSDPLNLLIRRVPLAGHIDGEYVILHNGHRVFTLGYYGEFSRILVCNRGVHEPLEEYVFQTLLEQIGANPIMLELGADWAHYSMWMKKERPNADVHMIEPVNLDVGIQNFARNGYTGTFTRAVIGDDQLTVSDYMRQKQLSRLDVLHADIQGFEMQMLNGCSGPLQAKIVNYLFISTHSQKLHVEVVRCLKANDYRIEVSSDFDNETTSYDGFVFASSPRVPPVMPGWFKPMSRVSAAEASPQEVVRFLRTLQTW